MNNGTNIKLQIQASYNQLTKAEKKVADYVLQNQSKVLYMSITDLADACEVGDTSVYRFCRTLKLQGYQEFKMKLSLSQREDSSESIKSGGRSKMREDSLGEMAERVLEQHLNAIKETFMLIGREDLEKTLEMFERARRVFFFGIGDSLLTAEEGRNKFLRITGKVTCIRDPHMQAMAASLTTAEDLIFIISYSGSSKDNIQSARIAKEAGAMVTCITHYKKSPLTVYCDAVLLCGSEEGPLEGGSMMAKQGQLYILDLLYQEYYKRNLEQCQRNHEKTTNSVVEKIF